MSQLIVVTLCVIVGAICGAGSSFGWARLTGLDADDRVLTPCYSAVVTGGMFIWAVVRGYHTCGALTTGIVLTLVIVSTCLLGALPKKACDKTWDESTRANTAYRRRIFCSSGAVVGAFVSAYFCVSERPLIDLFCSALLGLVMAVVVFIAFYLIVGPFLFIFERPLMKIRKQLLRLFDEPKTLPARVFALFDSIVKEQALPKLNW